MRLSVGERAEQGCVPATDALTASADIASKLHSEWRRASALSGCRMRLHFSPTQGFSGTIIVALSPISDCELDPVLSNVTREGDSYQ